MKEKPILFNTPMVRAILDGRKTVTRRAVKPRYVDGDAGFNIVTNSKTGAFCYIEYYDDYERSTDRRMTPPYHVDDILYVRETWCFYGGVYWHKAGLEVDENGDCKDGFWVNDISEPSGKKWVATKAPDKWRPSIHMPKEAARIWLRVTDVRVERLQDSFMKQGGTIFEIRAEGINIPEECRDCIDAYGFPCCIDTAEDDGSECGILDYPRSDFADLWDSTIKPADRGRYGWEANPFCWVIEFERIERPVIGE